MTFAIHVLLFVTPSLSTAECSGTERRDALRAMQAEVLQVAPARLESLDQAIAPGGVLAGWRLSHGYVALDGAGAVAVDNLAAQSPMPPLLLYAPSDDSTAADWQDFDGPDNPYTLVGWAYFAPYAPDSMPPPRPCVGTDEWFVHEAGWHLKDGGMQLTPGAAEEPPRPRAAAIHMWHPRIWDLHVWRGADGVPTISLRNPAERRGGRRLPPGAFLSMKDGGLRPVSDGR